MPDSCAVFLEPGITLAVEFVSGRLAHALFPDVIAVRIADTAPAAPLQADSAFKPTKLANGIEVMVPIQPCAAAGWCRNRRS